MFLRLGVVVVVCGAAIACAPVEGPVVVEALVPDADAEGGVALADVTLERILDLRTGRGRDFDVRGDLKIDAQEFFDLSGDFDDVVDRTRGNGGADVDPRMAFDGTRYVADDYETLFYFSVTANFEAAFAYARAAGDDSQATSDVESERAIVGLFASVVLSEFVPLPLLSSDNAAYAAPMDGWLALRTAFQEGVPFGMHRGVIAHEFGHRLFFHNTFSKIPGGFEVWQEQNTTTSDDPDELRSQMLLKAVDEGLADVFSMASLADKDAINAAFENAGDLFESEAARRDVEGVFATAATYDNLRTLTLDTTTAQGCGLTTPDFAQSFNYYCVGTVLAAAIWAGADNDAAIVRDEVQPAIIRALPRLGEAMVDGAAFDVDLLLEAIAAEIEPGARRDTMCAAFEARFESLFAEGRVPTCL